MSFNPDEHLIDLRGGKKNYLEVKWRLVWFRDEHPTGRIDTELILMEAGLVVMKATVIDGNGAILASGLGSATSGGNAVWKGREVEKAETACIGRALAHAGYGTQFTGEDESDNVVDSPVDRKSSKPRQNAPQGAQPKQQPQTPMQPQNAPAGSHWIDNDNLRKDFFAWCNDKKLTEAEIYGVLGVQSMHDYKSPVGHAKTDLMKYLKEGRTINGKVVNN